MKPLFKSRVPVIVPEGRSPVPSKLSNKNDNPKEEKKEKGRVGTAKKGEKPVIETKGKRGATATATKDTKAAPKTPVAKSPSAPPEKGRRERTPAGKKGKNSKLKLKPGKDNDDFDPDALTWEEKR